MLAVRSRIGAIDSLARVSFGKRGGTRGKARNGKDPRGAKRRCSYDTVPGGEGVLVGAFQSEREEETRDRAERGSVVRGSDQASVAPKRIPSPTQTEIYVAAALYRADEEVIASADKISW